MSPVITAIERRARGAVAVSLDDGEVPHLLPVELIIESALHEGVRLDDETWRALRARGQEALAVRRALEVLARRPRTAAELRAALVRRFDEQTADRAVERMRELRYLDDEAWAKSYVASSRAQARGSALLREELRRHGVAGPLAARVAEEHDDLAAALAAARKRLAALGTPDEERIRRRLYDFLRRRGFDDGIARLVVARLADS
ncbi:MAG: regulatory protein RecX [Chloroflexi bacterium]|nr:regulatory protein RecX [Chloroflexota bacterium]